MRPYRFRMRLSSKRLNVTRFGKTPAAAVRAAARFSLGSASSDIKIMAHNSCHLSYMIAPTAGGRKRAMATVCVSLTPENPAMQSHWIESDHALISLFKHDISRQTL